MPVLATSSTAITVRAPYQSLGASRAACKCDCCVVAIVVGAVALAVLWTVTGVALHQGWHDKDKLLIAALVITLTPAVVVVAMAKSGSGPLVCSRHGALL